MVSSLPVKTTCFPQNELSESITPTVKTISDRALFPGLDLLRRPYGQPSGSRHGSYQPSAMLPIWIFVLPIKPENEAVACTPVEPITTVAAPPASDAAS